MSPKTTALIEEDDFSLSMNIAALDEYCRRLKAFLSGHPLEEGLREDWSHIELFENDGNAELAKIYAKLDLSNLGLPDPESPNP